MNNANAKKKEMLQGLLAETYQKVLKKGYHGKVIVALNIQDGVFQDVEISETKKYK